jgi:GTPase Era involved in 16S rRNA processing
MSQETIIFIGSPGVGKSTLGNGLAGSLIFKSGISAGQGLSTFLQKHVTAAGRCIIDTPGLADVNLRKVAATEISQALKQGGYLKIIFVITLEGGRARPQDVDSIKLVTDAVPVNTPFAILLNKLTNREHSVLSQRGGEFNTVIGSLTPPGRAVPSSAIFMFPDIPTLKDVNNAVAPLGPDFMSWIAQLQAAVINPAVIKEVQPDRAAAEAEEKRRELELKEAEQRAAQAAQQAEIARLQQVAAQHSAPAPKKRKWYKI